MKLYLQKQVVSQVWPVIHSLVTPALEDGHSTVKAWVRVSGGWEPSELGLGKCRSETETTGGSTPAVCRAQ